MSVSGNVYVCAHIKERGIETETERDKKKGTQGSLLSHNLARTQEFSLGRKDTLKAAELKALWESPK